MCDIRTSLLNVALFCTVYVHVHSVQYSVISVAPESILRHSSQMLLSFININYDEASNNLLL